MRDGFVVVDTDAHLQEPMDIWERYVEAEYRERAPQINGDIGRLLFKYDPCESFPNGLAQPWPDSTVADVPERFGSSYEGWWALEDRLRDMDTEGIDVAFCFMSNGRAAVSPFLTDAKLSAALCRAWNNWATDYCHDSNGRVKFYAQVTLLDVDEAIKEVRRVADRPEVGGVVLPDLTGEQLWTEPQFDPFWATLCEYSLPACFHGGGSQRRWLRPWLEHGLAAAAHSVSFPLDCLLAMSTFIFGGVLERYPDLRLGFMEGNAGWVPWFLERMDDHTVGRGARFLLGTSLPRLPSEYFDGQCFVVCDADEATLPYAAERLNGGGLLFNSDYPHPDSGFPESVDEFLKQPITEDMKRRILSENAGDLYRDRLGSLTPA